MICFYSYSDKVPLRKGKSVAPIILTKINTSRLAANAKLVTFFCSVGRRVGYNGRVGSIYRLVIRPRSAL